MARLRPGLLRRRHLVRYPRRPRAARCPRLDEQLGLRARRAHFTLAQRHDRATHLGPAPWPGRPSTPAVTRRANELASGKARPQVFRWHICRGLLLARTPEPTAAAPRRGNTSHRGLLPNALL